MLRQRLTDQEKTIAGMRAALIKQQEELDRAAARAELPAAIQDAKLDGRAAMTEREQVITAARVALRLAERNAAELAWLLEIVGGGKAPSQSDHVPVEVAASVLADPKPDSATSLAVEPGPATSPSAVPGPATSPSAVPGPATSPAASPAAVSGPATDPSIAAGPATNSAGPGLTTSPAPSASASWFKKPFNPFIRLRDSFVPAKTPDEATLTFETGWLNNFTEAGQAIKSQAPVIIHGFIDSVVRDHETTFCATRVIEGVMVIVHGEKVLGLSFHYVARFRVEMTPVRY
jgi:hypothetical protein